MGLIKLAWRLGARDYSHIYDAHNNLRSKIVMGILRSRHLLRRLRGQAGFRFLRRPKSRLRRFLYFRFRLPVLPSPFRGAESFHRPLKSWGISESVPSGPQFFIEAELPEGVRTRLQNESKPVIVLAASAAWQMKRWPTQHWIQLIQEMNHAFFVLLGGPEDKFLSQLEQAAPERTLNLAGKLSLSQSASLLKRAELVIANDTGLLHVADQMSRPTIALIGPTAFGYPSHPTSQTLEIDLYCKPCSKDGRGKCINSLYQRCMVEISPERVKKAADEVLKS